MSQPKITMRDIVIDYRNEERGISHRAVQNVSLDVMADEFLCVVGPSGCGKSTLLAAIAGFLFPTSGALEKDGKPITGPGADRGVVFQEYALMPWKRVIDNVALGLKFRGVPKAERYEIANHYLQVANLTEAAQKFPHELSGGMKQRVAVARTLANEPDVMLMDEPFAAVDAQTRMTLQEELLRVWQRATVTVLFVTHRVEEAIFLADRVVVLSQGPGQVQDIVPIDIPRQERQWATLPNDPRYIQLRDRIMSMVRRDDAA